MYALWLLHRLAARNFPLTRIDHLRCRMATVLGLCGLILGLFFAVGVMFCVADMGHSVYAFVADYFNFAVGARRE